MIEVSCCLKSHIDDKFIGIGCRVFPTVSSSSYCLSTMNLQSLQSFTDVVPDQLGVTITPKLTFCLLLSKLTSGAALRGRQLMAFYIVRDKANGMYLSMRGDSWVVDLRDAAVFSLRSTAESTIRIAWRGRCVVERIERLPDRIPTPRRTKRSATGPWRAPRSERTARR